MTPRDFAFWMQGFFEIRDGESEVSGALYDKPLTSFQVKMIRQHLALVFKHEAGKGTLQPHPDRPVVEGPPVDGPGGKRSLLDDFEAFRRLESGGISVVC